MEHKPYGSEINVFSTPLFSNELDFNLNYADTKRSPEDVIDRTGKTPTQIANEFLLKVKPIINQAEEKDSIQYFLTRIEEDQLFENTRIGFDYALALVLEERFEEARKHLITVANCEWEKRVVPEEAKCAKDLATLIDSNPESAVDVINDFLQANRQQIVQFKSAIS